MFEFVSKALLALVLDKRAREALDAARTPAPPVPATGVPPALPAARTKPAPRVAPESQPASATTPDRRELIQRALELQQSKQYVLDGLSEDAKAKLLIAAVKALRIPPDEIERSLSRRRKAAPGDSG